MNHPRALSILAFLALVGCSKSPPKPETGAPVLFETVSLDDENIAVRVYNFSEKALAGYDLAIRYRDAKGAIVPARFGRVSVSGLSYKAQPHAWTPLKLTRVSVPSGATKAEILATSTTAVAADGLRLEAAPLWHMDGSGWPGK